MVKKLSDKFVEKENKKPNHDWERKYRVIHMGGGEENYSLSILSLLLVSKYTSIYYIKKASAQRKRYV